MRLHISSASDGLVPCGVRIARMQPSHAAAQHSLPRRLGLAIGRRGSISASNSWSVMTKSGSTRSRSFLLPGRLEKMRHDGRGTDGDDRIIRESGIDARVASDRPACSARYRLSPRSRALVGQNGLTLQIMAERAGRHHERRGLRRGQPRGVAGARRRGPRSRRPIIWKYLRPASIGRWSASRTLRPGPAIC